MYLPLLKQSSFKVQCNWSFHLLIICSLLIILYILCDFKLNVFWQRFVFVCNLHEFGNINAVHLSWGSMHFLSKWFNSFSGRESDDWHYNSKYKKVAVALESCSCRSINFPYFYFVSKLLPGEKWKSLQNTWNLFLGSYLLLVTKG